MKIFSLNQIQENINLPRDLEGLINSQKSTFVNFSSGLYHVPPPMQFIFPETESDCHIKGGYRIGSRNFVIKIAGSSKFGNNGAILIFDSESCELIAILQDKGYLTTLRTAITGMICLTIMTYPPKNIGIIGSGSLARQISELVKIKYPQANIMIHARNKAKAASISGLLCDSVEDLVEKCDVVFTATSSPQPMIHEIPQDRNMIVIALGSDDEQKSEVSYHLYEKADMVIVDSKLQAAKFGDVSKALRAGIIDQKSLVELGEVLNSNISENPKTIIADFSGIGAQDVAMAEFILSAESARDCFVADASQR